MMQSSNNQDEEKKEDVCCQATKVYDEKRKLFYIEKDISLTPEHVKMYNDLRNYVDSILSRKVPWKLSVIPDKMLEIVDAKDNDNDNEKKQNNDKNKQNKNKKKNKKNQTEELATDENPVTSPAQRGRSAYQGREGVFILLDPLSLPTLSRR